MKFWPGWTGFAAAAAGLVLLGSAAAATPALAKTHAEAQAFSLQIVLPGQQQPVGTTPAAAPPDASSLGESYSYPSDGSVVSTGVLTATASTVRGSGRASAEATSQVVALKLFGGEITAQKISIRAAVHAGPRAAAGQTGGVGLTGLVVLGQAVMPTANQRIPLADWGYAVALERSDLTTAPAGMRAHAVEITALDVHLTAAHGGLPLGSQVEIGFARAQAQVAVPRPTPIHHHHNHHHASHRSHHHASRHHARAQTHHRAHPTPKPPEPKASPFGPPPVQPPPNAKKTIRLSAPGGYVFPVYGPVSFTDTFGAARSDVGWHHGDDIFAPLGAPVVAVANGTVFSVGWNDLGGNRLWLKDGQGNEFYYAHLSAFAPRAVNGARVRAGDVLGFVGNTGDAVSTPYHLHFEIHPVSMLGMGYDGVVDPTNYLEAWQHLQGLQASGQGAGGDNSAGARAPEPGAILVSTRDISSAKGLAYKALKKVLYASRHAVVTEGDNLLTGAAPTG